MDSGDHVIKSFPLLRQTANSSVFSFRDDIFRHITGLESSKVYIMSVAGDSRAGKISILKAMVAILAKSGYIVATDGNYIESSQYLSACFPSAGSNVSLTHGIDAVILRSRDDDKVIVLLDLEGLNNGDHGSNIIFLNALLAIATISQRLIVVVNKFTDSMGECLELTALACAHYNLQAKSSLTMIWNKYNSRQDD